MVEINLLSWRESKKKFHIKMIFFIYSIIFGFVALALIGFHGYLLHKSSLENEKIQFLVSQQEKMMNHMTKKKNVSQEDEIVLSKVKKQKIIFDLMADLFRLHVANIHLTEVSLKNNNLVMLGSSEKAGDIYPFMSQLISLKKIHAVKLDSMTQKGGSVQFQLHTLEF